MCSGLTFRARIWLDVWSLFRAQLDVTVENDTFHKICSNAGIADGKRRAYLEWLEERHNIGRRRSDGANRELLIKDPFITR